VIVTGAGAGIGRATAERIAREGGRVIASDISGSRLESLVAEHQELRILPVAGDIGLEDTVQRVVSAAGDVIHGLANVAGIMDDFTPVHEVSDAVWDRVFHVNVAGVVRLMRAVVPIMLAAGSGSIVNVASEAGLRGSAAGVAYTASKHAVIGITRSSAVMYGPRGLRVNAVAPGPVRTNMAVTFGSVLAQERLGPLLRTMLPAVAEAWQVAASITFLLSRDGTNVNGAILPSDGGWSAL